MSINKENSYRHGENSCDEKIRTTFLISKTFFFVCFVRKKKFFYKNIFKCSFCFWFWEISVSYFEITGIQSSYTFVVISEFLTESIWNIGVKKSFILSPISWKGKTKLL